MKKLAWLSLLLLLGGCTNGVGDWLLTGVGFGRSIVDKMVSRGGSIAEKGMVKLDVIDRELEVEKQRLRYARCLFPYISLRKYALASEENHAVVKRDCGLDVKQVKDIGLDPGAKKPK